MSWNAKKHSIFLLIFMEGKAKNEGPISAENIRKDYPLALDSCPRVVRAVCDPVVNYLAEVVLGRRAIAHVNEIIRANMDKVSHDFVRGVLSMAGMDLRVSDSDFAKVPSKGRAIIASTHPNGMADMMVCDLVMRARGDVKFLVTSLLSALLSNANDVCITVPIFTEKSDELRTIVKAQLLNTLHDDEALVMFPAGGLPRPKHFMRPSAGLEEGEWKPGVICSAEETGSPIIPVHAEAVSSKLCYALRSLGLFGELLSQTRVFREFVGSQGRSFGVKVGDPIYPDELADRGGATYREKAQYVRQKALELGIE